MFDARVIGVPAFIDLTGRLPAPRRTFHASRIAAAHDALANLLDEEGVRELDELWRSPAAMRAHITVEREAIMQPLVDWLASHAPYLENLVAAAARDTLIVPVRRFLPLEAHADSKDSTGVAIVNAARLLEDCRDAAQILETDVAFRDLTLPAFFKASRADVERTTSRHAKDPEFWARFGVMALITLATACSKERCIAIACLNEELSPQLATSK